MINRYYKDLKFKRTYTGGSKEKELEIFNQVQHGGPECDWLEYRRILFPYLEDVMHITFSRSFASKRLAFVLLGFSFLLGLLHVQVLSVIVILFSVFFYVSHKVFEKKITETLSAYNMSVNTVKREIKITTGLDI